MAETLANGRFFGGVRRDLRLPSVTLAETGYDPGFAVPSHTHHHPFFCLVLQGSFAESVDRRSWTARPASVFFHPAQAEHAESFGERGGRVFNIQLEDSWLASMAEFDRPPPDAQVEAHGGRLAHLAGRVLSEFRRDGVPSALRLEECLTDLFAEVCAWKPPTVDRLPPRWLRRVEELLDARLARPMDIAQVAAEVGVHPVHLARTFRRHRGCTPGEYLRRRRIERGCQLLVETPASLAQVAAEVGFADQSHFTRGFRREMGVTPGEFRRILHA